MSKRTPQSSKSNNNVEESFAKVTVQSGVAAALES